MNVDTLIERSRPFLSWVVDWQESLKPASLRDLVSQAGPDAVGIVSVDVIKGFCSVGPLASPRVDGIIAPIAALLRDAWALGVRNIALTQDAHPVDAVEFASYAPHCIRGTVEAETVDAFRALPFFDSIPVFEKNSINSAFATGFQAWLDTRAHVKTWIAVGDCTDLCTYQLAMHLRLSANQHQRAGVRVIVPVNAVDTYNLPVDTAQQIGAVPHDGDLLHIVFLYSMMLNGVEVVSEVVA
ncbi:MAG: cysteine hydrolase [Chloroflexi bacterium]|nr:cysteine hydrolase [Chloroflexota bacterium]